MVRIPDFHCVKSENPGGLGSISGWETEIPQATWHGQKEKQNKTKKRQRSLLKKWMCTFNSPISVWKFILLLADENYSRNLDHSGTGLYSPPVLHFHLGVGPRDPHSPDSSLFNH